MIEIKTHVTLDNILQLVINIYLNTHHCTLQLANLSLVDLFFYTYKTSSSSTLLDQ